ncbi:hypothetical protein RTBOTA2_001949 [Rhodotorula toruloides]|uniref:FGENESH: predicted gene_8.356 protein n=1 Tax=Rhodotorula toruloides TaxID=5286 RepID=A0A0K3CJE8_RHOTO|nr:hypothetical protein RTBOTA2_001949 [Rhodotorula toruloides]
MLLVCLATAVLAFFTLSKASNSSSETLPDLDPADLPDPRTLIYKEVCFRNVFDDAGAFDELSAISRSESQLKSSPITWTNNHRIFCRTGTKEDFDPITDNVEEGEGEGQGVVVGFEEFCYRMRKAKGDVGKEGGAGASAKKSK